MRRRLGFGRSLRGSSATVPAGHRPPKDGRPSSFAWSRQRTWAEGARAGTEASHHFAVSPLPRPLPSPGAHLALGSMLSKDRHCDAGGTPSRPRGTSTARRHATVAHRHATAAHRHATASHRHATAAHRHASAAHRDAKAAHRHSSASPRHGCPSPRPGSSSPRHGGSSPRHGGSSPRHGSPSPRHGRASCAPASSAAPGAPTAAHRHGTPGALLVAHGGALFAISAGTPLVARGATLGGARGCSVHRSPHG